MERFAVRHPSIPHLSEQCRTETDNFLHQRDFDPQYCYELFVRAFRHGDSVALDQLLSVYQGLVIHWAKRHSLFGALHSHRERIAHYVFSKMWRSTHGERFTFDTLPAILAYLRDCINAALAEMYRDYISTPREMSPGSMVIEDEGGGDTPDFELLWQRICLILPEADLQKLVWYSFVYGYKPEQLMQEHPDHFPTTAQIRVAKQKAVRRLRKDPLLRRWFGLPPDEL
jgi:hypothetical protein